MFLLKLIFTILFCSGGCFYSERKPIRGVYTPEINSYQFLVPHKVNLDGSVESFHLPNFVEHDFQQSRRKRNAEHPHLVAYNLHFNGKDHLIYLWPNHGFLAPETVVEHHPPGSRETVAARKIHRMNPDLCHFTGIIKGEDGSKAALSLCDGLAGYLKTGDGVYYIEPVEDFGPNEMGHHLHVIYEHPKNSMPAKDHIRRSRMASKGIENCGAAENWHHGWEKAFQQYFTTIQPNQFTKSEAREERKSHKPFHRYLEVLVVADKMFLDFHKDKDYENYILTVMNMVSDFYHDASTGNQLDVTIVRIIYLDQEMAAFDLHKNLDANQTLESFCQWQNEINPRDVDHPQHHDIAVLITRHDICSDSDSDGNKNCGLLGLAYMASACVPTDSCTINEDTGLLLGVVIAHELGHIMGCEHDSGEKSGCSSKADEKFNHVMSPFMSLATSVWSSCSRTYMTELLENNLGQCLENEPQTSLYKFDDMLPGAIYDADYQCNLIFPGSVKCENNPEFICGILYCRISEDKCLSTGEPPAEGTECGANKWCIQQECVSLGERRSGINGGWDDWSDFGPCSRSCGGGIRISRRTCTSPAPQNRGRYCVGESKRYEVCNPDPCPEGSIPFRSVQCAYYNDCPWNEEEHEWIPQFVKHRNVDTSCALYCINEEGTIAKLAPRAKDGTPCKPGTRNMCVLGECRKVGCDWKLDSNAFEDKCGVCGGDNSGCKRFAGTFTTGRRGYTKVRELPEGARNIKIIESAPSENTIAIADEDGNFYLNGNTQEECDGEKHFGSDMALYQHPVINQEELFIPGPLNQTLIFYVVFFDPVNVGYTYEFFMLDESRSCIENTTDGGFVPFHWEFLTWSECSARCEGGEKKSEAVCVSDNGEGAVSSSFCPKEDKPETKVKICNKQPCEASWNIGEWSSCSGCKHRSGYQTRKVWCAKESPKWVESDILLDDSECRAIKGPKPNQKQLCVGPCSDDCPKTKRSPHQLGNNFFKEYYREVDLLSLEPEGVLVGVKRSWKKENANDPIKVEQEGFIGRRVQNIERNLDSNRFEKDNSQSWNKDAISDVKPGDGNNQNRKCGWVPQYCVIKSNRRSAIPIKDDSVGQKDDGNRTARDVTVMVKPTGEAVEVVPEGFINSKAKKTEINQISNRFLKDNLVSLNKDTTLNSKSGDGNNQDEKCGWVPQYCIIKPKVRNAIPINDDSVHQKDDVHRKARDVTVMVRPTGEVVEVVPEGLMNSKTQKTETNQNSNIFVKDNLVSLNKDTTSNSKLGDGNNQDEKCSWIPQYCVIKSKARGVTAKNKDQSVQKEDDDRILRDSTDIDEPPDHEAVEDGVSESSLRVYEVPFVPLAFQNLSDEAFQKLGDKASGSIDLGHEQVFKGADAICVMDNFKPIPGATEAPEPPPAENSPDGSSDD